jgi:chitin disaccharide deacetylase
MNMRFSRLIVNADDFGYSEAVNKAILTGFESALLTSTSLMANMPGFDDAVGILRRGNVAEQQVGVHLNLTEGFALSGAVADCPTFCAPDGRFVYRRDRSLFRLSRKERVAVYEELRRQLERVLAAGIRPTHLDSHHHVHTEWAIAPLVCRLARTYGIRRVRLTRNIGPVGNRAKHWYKTFFNFWFLGRGSGLVDNTDYFGDISDMKYSLNIVGGRGMGGRTSAGGRIGAVGRSGAGGRSRDRSVEIMVHPKFDPSGRLVDLDGKDLRAELRVVEGLGEMENPG